ncbi:hypothetical protein LZ086_14885 [Acinetobacter johnsonii]|nr:hypothetical protein LZ086_14885 [Acinetobacter johnsonii]
MSSFNLYLYAHGVAEQFLPDEYRLENHQLSVPASFILSRMSNGTTLSQFGDDVWDFSPYLPKCYCKLNFKTWLENAREDDFLFAQIRAEMKKSSLHYCTLKQASRLLKVLSSAILCYDSLQSLPIAMAVHCSSYLAMLFICQK